MFPARRGSLGMLVQRLDREASIGWSKHNGRTTLSGTPVSWIASPVGLFELGGMTSVNEQAHLNNRRRLQVVTLRRAVVHAGLDINLH